MKTTFKCPNCKNKQHLKNLFLMNRDSSWRCHKCNTLIKPKNLSSNSNIIGFLSVVFPSYFSIFILKYKLLPSLLVGLLFGLLTYILSLVYFYKNCQLEEI